MIRGTTPTHVFALPFKTSLLKEIRITYAQAGSTIVEKTTEDCTLGEDTITVTLTQKDTLKFSSCGTGSVSVQLKVLTTAGDVLATSVKRVMVEEILNTEVLV